MGQTYLEKFGTKDVKCGFQPGDKNVAKRTDVRMKISEGLKKYYMLHPEAIKKKQYDTLSNKNNLLKSSFKKKYRTKKGELCRSKLELSFANFLYDNNIEYESEVYTKLKNGHIKIVDFVIDNHILIEVTGYGFDNWKKEFNKKMNILQLSTDKIIMIVTYKYNMREIWKNIVKTQNIFVYDEKNKARILQGITFCKSLPLQIHEVI